VREMKEDPSEPLCRGRLQAPDPLGAVFGTINLAAVAAAADQHLHPTARAKKQPR
jgi:hypothetical protein